MTDDELDDLLTPKDAPPDDALREAIFAKTRPRRPWRPWKPVTWAAVFALGGAAGWFAKPTPAPERVIEKEFVPVPAEAVSPGEQMVERPADRLELDAEMAADAPTAAALFRQAGDRYLKASKIESALRCYRQYLAEAGPDGRTVRPDDSWLLTSLKNSRTENDHAISSR